MVNPYDVQAESNQTKRSAQQCDLLPVSEDIQLYSRTCCYQSGNCHPICELMVHNPDSESVVFMDSVLAPSHQDLALNWLSVSEVMKNVTKHCPPILNGSFCRIGADIPLTSFRRRQNHHCCNLFGRCQTTQSTVGRVVG